MLSTMKFQTKLGLGLIAAAVAVVVAMSLANYLGTRRTLLEEGRVEALRTLNQVSIAIAAVQELTQSQVNSDMATMKRESGELGAPSLDPTAMLDMNITNQITSESEKARVPTLAFGSYKVNGDYTFVDRIQKEAGGGTVTIFQVLPGKLLRVSTNVLKLDGSRAVGTYIPDSSPVYKAVMAGQVYKGTAYVVNAWYLTAYFPVL